MESWEEGTRRDAAWHPAPGSRRSSHVRLSSPSPTRLLEAARFWANKRTHTCTLMLPHLTMV